MGAVMTPRGGLARLSPDDCTASTPADTDLPRPSSRTLRLEQLLLLAVRCLVVVLLTLAMASVMPWAEAMWRQLFPEGVGPNLAAGGKRTHKIVVVDVKPDVQIERAIARGMTKAEA